MNYFPFRPRHSRFLVIALLAATCVFCACRKKSKEEDDTFKKEALLTNVADNYITPGYAAHLTAVTQLQQSWNAFEVSMTTQNHIDLQTKWKAAAITFQKIRMFDFGPAMTTGMIMSQGIFPADTIQISANLSSGSYNLSTHENKDAVGFDALDFLLFKPDAYSILTTSAIYRGYVEDLISLMYSQIQSTNAQWSSYRASFVTSTGTEITSGFSALVNSFSKDFEIVKSAKIGVPIGTATLGIHKPTYFEARRSGYGKELLYTNLEALEALFYGNSYNGSTGTGFDDYLNALERSELTEAIGSRLTSLASTPQTWSGTLSNILSTDEHVLEDYYDVLYATVPFIKADMASAFNVVITYQDNDGD